MCDSEDEVLDGCDAVYICTWTSEHPRQVAKASSARGLAIFCEKPLATLAAEIARADGGQGRCSRRHQPSGPHPATLARLQLPNQYCIRLILLPARVMTVVFRDDQFIPIQGHYSSTWRTPSTRRSSGRARSSSTASMTSTCSASSSATSGPGERQHGQLPWPHDGIEDVANVHSSHSFSSWVRSARSRVCGTTTWLARAFGVSRCSVSAATSLVIEGP